MLNAAIGQMYRCITQRNLAAITPKSWADFEKEKIEIHLKTCKRYVMTKINENRVKWLHIRLTDKEHQKLHSKFSKSTCSKLSDYARKTLLDKPITIKVRNQSLDDFMAEMIVLRNELNAIGNNYNQLVKRLHSLQQFSEIKSWLLFHESARKILL